MSSFELNAVKGDANRSKHGIDFVQAQQLWTDPMLLKIPAKTEDEPRYLVIGLLDGEHCSTVTTYRGSQYSIDIGSTRTRRRGGTLGKLKSLINWSMMVSTLRLLWTRPRPSA